MCKSKQQGGQRCAGHAKERMDTLMAQGEESLRRLQRGEITHEAAVAMHAKVSDAMIDYASTLEGSAAFRQDIADGEALYQMTGDPEDLAAVEDIRRLVNDGALRANRNRWAENQWRAERHMQPLTTPLPLTLQQEREAAQAAEAAAQAHATRAADPFGLRAALPDADLARRSAATGVDPNDAPYRLSAQPPAPTAAVYDGALDPATIQSQVATALTMVEGTGNRRVQPFSPQAPTPGTKPCGCLPAEAGGARCRRHADEHLVEALNGLHDDSRPALSRFKTGTGGVLLAAQNSNSDIAKGMEANFRDNYRNAQTAVENATTKAEAKRAAKALRKTRQAYHAYAAVQELTKREQCEAEDAWRIKHGFKPRYADWPPMRDREDAVAVRGYLIGLSEARTVRQFFWTGLRARRQQKMFNRIAAREPQPLA